MFKRSQSDARNNDKYKRIKINNNLYLSFWRVTEITQYQIVFRINQKYGTLKITFIRQAAQQMSQLKQRSNK